MRKSVQVWDLYLQSKTWGTRPSIIVDVEDSYAAFCLDQAVYHFGAQLEALLEGVDGKNERTRKSQRQRIMEAVLQPDLPESRLFADPADFFAKKG